MRILTASDIIIYSFARFNKQWPTGALKLTVEINQLITFAKVDDKKES